MTVDYSCSNGFYENLEDIKKVVDTIKGSIIIIGHSLGGIYAMHLAEYLGDRCQHVISLSTPFGGSGLADWAKLLYPYHKLFKDVGHRSKPIIESKKIWSQLSINWLQVVTVSGNAPWIPSQNDGVITVKSQCCLDTMPQVSMTCNHYEILIHPDTVTILEAYSDTFKLDIF